MTFDEKLAGMLTDLKFLSVELIKRDAIEAATSALNALSMVEGVRDRVSVAGESETEWEGLE